MVNVFRHIFACSVNKGTLKGLNHLTNLRMKGTDFLLSVVVLQVQFCVLPQNGVNDHVGIKCLPVTNRENDALYFLFQVIHNLLDFVRVGGTSQTH